MSNDVTQETCSDVSISMPPKSEAKPAIKSGTADEDHPPQHPVAIDNIEAKN